MTIITPFGEFMIIAFLVLGVVASLVSLTVITAFVATNRRDRLARHESVGHYYRGLALTH